MVPGVLVVVDEQRRRITVLAPPRGRHVVGRPALDLAGERQRGPPDVGEAERRLDADVDVQPPAARGLRPARPRPSSSSTSCTTPATRRTVAGGHSGIGSRSMRHSSGFSTSARREFQGWNSTVDICTAQITCGQLGHAQLVGVQAVAREVDPHGLQPRRGAARHPLLVDLLAAHPLGEAVHHARPLPQGVDDPRPDRQVVLDEVELGRSRWPGSTPGRGWRPAPCAPPPGPRSPEPWPQPDGTEVGPPRSAQPAGRRSAATAHAFVVPGPSGVHGDGARPRKLVGERWLRPPVASPAWSRRRGAWWSSSYSRSSPRATTDGRPSGVSGANAASRLHVTLGRTDARSRPRRRPARSDRHGRRPADGTGVGPARRRDHIADGEYLADQRLVASASGTAAAPITLRGSRAAILRTKNAERRLRAAHHRRPLADRGDHRRPRHEGHRARRLGRHGDRRRRGVRHRRRRRPLPHLLQRRRAPQLLHPRHRPQQPAVRRGCLRRLGQLQLVEVRVHRRQEGRARATTPSGC